MCHRDESPQLPHHVPFLQLFTWFWWIWRRNPCDNRARGVCLSFAWLRWCKQKRQSPTDEHMMRSRRATWMGSFVGYRRVQTEFLPNKMNKSVCYGFLWSNRWIQNRLRLVVIKVVAEFMEDNKQEDDTDSWIEIWRPWEEFMSKSLTFIHLPVQDLNLHIGVKNVISLYPWLSWSQIHLWNIDKEFSCERPDLYILLTKTTS